MFAPAVLLFGLLRQRQRRERGDEEKDHCESDCLHVRDYASSGRDGRLPSMVNRQTFALGRYEDALARLEREWSEEGHVRRIWDRDESLWTSSGESAWLGWLDVVGRQLGHVDSLAAFSSDVRAAGFTDAVVLGMGGSSLCPEVLGRTLGSAPGSPTLHVLDSTVPSQVAALEACLDLEKTLFVVASKSGSTAEPNAFEAYFFDRVGDGSQFVAVTDPGSSLESMARDKGYRAVFFGEPEIGGRFSALSNFGMVPAAIMGLDVRAFLESASEMVSACGRDVAPADNPGVRLGLALGALAREGRDKLTLLASPELRAVGAWIEQLVAESTGKQGKGILPVDLEPEAEPAAYGSDRVFVQLTVGDREPPACTAGHPVIRIALGDAGTLGQEFYRWEVATAVAGAVMELDPFDQPDVEASKVKTRALMARYRETGETPDAPEAASSKAVRALVDTLRPGDYFAISAYVDRNEENDRALQSLRERVLRDKHVATTLGYGPALSPFHRAAPQGRSEPWCLPAAARGRRARDRDPRPGHVLRSAEGLPGPRGPRGAAGTRAEVSRGGGDGRAPRGRRRSVLRLIALLLANPTRKVVDCYVICGKALTVFFDTAERPH